jgi:transketolase
MSEQREDSIRTLERKAIAVRKHIVRMVANAGRGHIAPALSCVDIVVALYFDALRLGIPVVRWAMDRKEFAR